MSQLEITIIYDSYKWQANEQKDGKTFIVREWSGVELVNTYAIPEDELDSEILDVMKGSVR